MQTKNDELKMMTEWSESLLSRLDEMDLRHAKIALEWFYSFASSKIKTTEDIRAMDAVAKLNPPNEKS
jgi:hypothetical protein